MPWVGAMQQHPCWLFSSWQTGQEPSASPEGGMGSPIPSSYPMLAPSARQRKLTRPGQAPGRRTVDARWHDV
jgi:hypothetical protein